MSDLVREQIREVAWELHMGRGCRGSMACMFPAQPYTWCTSREAARVVGIANRASAEAHRRRDDQPDTSDLRKIVDSTHTSGEDWPTVYARSAVSRRLTGQDDQGYADADFIRACTPVLVSALLDLYEAVLNEDHEALFAALDRLEEVRRD